MQQANQTFASLKVGGSDIRGFAFATHQLMFYRVAMNRRKSLNRAGQFQTAQVASCNLEQSESLISKGGAAAITTLDCGLTVPCEDPPVIVGNPFGNLTQVVNDSIVCWSTVILGYGEPHVKLLFEGFWGSPETLTELGNCCPICDELAAEQNLQPTQLLYGRRDWSPGKINIPRA
ncbi:hypothetical protein V492_00975 [Pseudogymnoascus sp. VKM F-4246]|nr:hypothetical protein V492_00975 [Pseudogymnoascus sp. VKM F-4246]